MKITIRGEKVTITKAIKEYITEKLTISLSSTSKAKFISKDGRLRYLSSNLVLFFLICLSSLSR